jgi:ABC-2 type transport system ATP-binding protein
VPPASARAEAERLLKILTLWDNRNDRCETFSRGMKQKAVLAGALLHQPKLLMLDEPLTGLDAAASRLVKDMIRERVDQGAGVILTTHILEVAERMADRIGIIKDGKLLIEGSLEELRTQAGAQGQSLEDVFLSLTAQPAATRETADAQ